ncbi:MAG: hypothetical protein IT302_11535 [Dehalococcoidia bacterium]|nr:hypothetical protein [Dehalococcoidia bacterium]
MTVALPLTGHRARIEDAGDGTLRIVRLADGTPAGRIRLETHGRDLYIAALCIDVPARGYGLGSEAARLLREAAEAGPWDALTAWAPPHLGLAVYFWSRMGLRPLHGEGPAGGIAFRRELRRPTRPSTP